MEFGLNFFPGVRVGFSFSALLNQIKRQIKRKFYSHIKIYSLSIPQLCRPLSLNHLSLSLPPKSLNIAYSYHLSNTFRSYNSIELSAYYMIWRRTHVVHLLRALLLMKLSQNFQNSHGLGILLGLKIVILKSYGLMEYNYGDSDVEHGDIVFDGDSKEMVEVEKEDTMYDNLLKTLGSASESLSSANKRS